MLSAKGTGRIKLQIIGFIGCAVGLGLAAISLNLPDGDKTILLHTIGTQTLLIILVGTSILGAVLTWVFRVETRGSLEKIEEARVQPQV